MTKVNIREALNQMDKDTNCKYDLVTLYEGYNFNDEEKKEIAKMISDNEDAEVIYDRLSDKFGKDIDFDDDDISDIILDEWDTTVDNEDYIDFETIDEDYRDELVNDLVKKAFTKEQAEYLVSHNEGMAEYLAYGNADNDDFEYYIKYINKRLDESTTELVEDSEETDDLISAEQEFDSAATSINSNKLPAVYNMIKFNPGDVVVDFGGGKFDNAVNYLKDQDVTLLVYDPYNRSAEHNKDVLRVLKEHGGADAAVNSNVLNVIKEPEARNAVLQNIKKITKKGAPIYITVYEGTGKGNEGPTKSGYQLNRKTSDYMDEISQVFSNVTRKGKLITAINESLTEDDKSTAFNDKYFPRVDINNTSRYDTTEFKDKFFAYDKKNNVLIYLFKDDEEVSEMGWDNAPWRELDSAGLSSDNWNDEEARNDYLYQYTFDLDSESSYLAQDFIDNELPYYQNKNESLNKSLNEGLSPEKGDRVRMDHYSKVNNGQEGTVTGRIGELCWVTWDDGTKSKEIKGYLTVIERDGRVVNESATDPRYYKMIEYTYDGDNVSDYLGHVRVRTNSDKVALRAAEKYAMSKHPEDNPGHFKIVDDNYTNVDVVDSDGDYLTTLESIDESKSIKESSSGSKYVTRDIINKTRSQKLKDAYDEGELEVLINGDIWYTERCPKGLGKELKSEMKRLYPDIKYLYGESVEGEVETRKQNYLKVKEDYSDEVDTLRRYLDVEVPDICREVLDLIEHLPSHKISYATKICRDFYTNMENIIKNYTMTGDNLKESSYGGAFDIADDEYFTKEELVEFGEDVVDNLNSLAYSRAKLESIFIENNVIEITITWDGNEITVEQPIDMRRIRTPKDLDKYRVRVISKMKPKLEEVGFDFGPHLGDYELSESSYGGAYDIPDDAYFTKEDGMIAANEVAYQLEKEFPEAKLEVMDMQLDNHSFYVVLTDKDGNEFTEEITLDMRKIRHPLDLIKKYAPALTERFIKQIKDYYSEM